MATEVENTVLCLCNVPAMKKTSKTPLNPDREFYTCHKDRYDKNKCRYFKWADEQNRTAGTAAEPGYLPTPPASQEPSTPRPSQAQRASTARGETPQSQLTSTSSQINHATTSTPRPPQTPSGGGITRSSQFTPAQREKIMEAIRLGAETTLPLTPSSAHSNAQSTGPARESVAQCNLDQTPSQFMHRGNDIRSYSTGSQRPLPSIDSTLKNVEAPQASPMKRSHTEATSEEDNFWQSERGTSDGRSCKIPRVPSAHDVTDASPLSPIPKPFMTPSTKGKGRETVTQATNGTLPSDPENPFDIHASGSSSFSLGGLLTPGTTARSNSFGDQLELMAEGLPAIIAEFRRMERKLISLEKSESSKLKIIKKLKEERDEYKEKYEKGEEHRLHLESIIDGMVVRR